MSLTQIYTQLDALLSEGAGVSRTIAAGTLSPSVTGGTAARKRAVEVATGPRYTLDVFETRYNAGASSPIDNTQLRDIEIRVLVQQSMRHPGRRGAARHARSGAVSDLCRSVEGCLTFPGNFAGTGLVSGMLELVSMGQPRTFPEEKLTTTEITFRGVLLETLTSADATYLVTSSGARIITSAGNTLVIRT